jgi:hypothetical protein
MPAGQVQTLLCVWGGLCGLPEPLPLSLPHPCCHCCNSEPLSCWQLCNNGATFWLLLIPLHVLTCLLPIQALSTLF